MGCVSQSHLFRWRKISGSFGEFGDMDRPGWLPYGLVCLCFVRPVSVSAAAVGLLVLEQLSRLLTREPPVDLGPFLLALPFQVLVLCFSFARSGIRRVPKHCRQYRLSSISAWLSQLPCLGV